MVAAVMTAMVSVMTVMVMTAAKVESDRRRIGVGSTIVVRCVVAPIDRHMPPMVPVRVAMMVVSVP